MTSSKTSTGWFRWLLVLLFFTAGCGSPRIVVVPKTADVVFTSGRAVNGSDAGNGVTNIWTMNSDGTNVRPMAALTATDASSASPVWSPNGAKIAFESMRALDGSNNAIPAMNIWVMNADGSSPVPMTKLNAPVVTSIHAAWSPDSAKIAFDSTRVLDGRNALGPVPNLWVVKADGSGMTALTTSRIVTSVSPVWSPDGTKIAFASSQALNGMDLDIAVRNIWVMNSDGTGVLPLTKLRTASSGDQAWSPDGTRIAFISTRVLDGTDGVGNAANVWLMNSDGSNPRPLTHQTDSNITTQAPVWSPNSGKILYVSSRALDGTDVGSSVLNLWMMNADGSGQKPLTSMVAATNYQPTWSSDGSRILFCSTRALDGTDRTNTNATWNVWMMNSDGTTVHPLTESTAHGADSAGPQWLR